MTDAPVAEPAYVDTRPFWDGARAGRFVLQRCRETGRFQHVPRPVSLYTGSRDLEWAEASGAGTVAARTVARMGTSRIDGRSPHVIAAIHLAEGVTFLSELVGPERFDLAIGAAVQVVWVVLQDGRAWPAFEAAGPGAAPAQYDIQGSSRP